MNMYIETCELADPRQFCGMPVTPYQVGFEHASMGIYHNDFAGDARREYDDGFADGSASVTVWNPLNHQVGAVLS